MNLRLVLRARVREDIERAPRWYEAEREGLGERYLAAIDVALASDQELATRCPEAHDRVRRALVKRFPYAVFGVIDGEQIVVLAVLHQAADPASWPGW